MKYPKSIEYSEKVKVLQDPTSYPPERTMRYQIFKVFFSEDTNACMTGRNCYCKCKPPLPSEEEKSWQVGASSLYMAHVPGEEMKGGGS